MKPKQFWKDEAEAQQCLKEWQERLGLNDWHIILRIGRDIPKDGLGFCQPNFSLRMATIDIASKDSDKHLDNYLKTNQELILVHELGHCILPMLSNTVLGESSSEAWYNITIHQATERFARAMFSAKYGLEPEWFFN